MVCLGNMCVDTLHKGDNDDNNSNNTNNSTFGAISLHWSLKTRSNQHDYAKYLLTQIVFTYSPVALWRICVDETGTITQLAVLKKNSSGL